MKKSSVFLILLTVSIFKISGQQNYGDIATNQHSAVFSESFESNGNNWITDNQWISGKFSNGHYEITCKNFNQNTGLSYKTVNIDFSKDFEIETSFTILKGRGALIFGLTKDFEHYRVEIDENKTLTIVKNIPSKNKIDKLFSGKEEAVIKDIGFYNKLTIRKLLGAYYVFANDLLIKKFDNLIFSGDQIGFSVGVNSEIAVDYLNVSYLVSKTDNILADQKIPKPDTAKAEPVKTAIVSPPNTTNVTALQTTPKDTIKAVVQKEVKVITPPLPPPPAGPQITWVSPSAATTPLDSYTNSARVRASVKSTTVIKSALIYVNGESRGDGDIRPVTGENGTYIVEKLITLNPGENNIYLVATNVEGASNKSDLRYFTNPLASLPEIRWGMPVPPQSLVNTETITLEVCIKSPADLLSANVTVDGVQVRVAKIFQRSNSDSCNYVWKPQIILKEGDNSVYVNAENIAGSNISENRLIKFNRAIAEKRIALVFGNSDYVNGTSLKNPVNDANLMEATLKDLGFTVIKQLNASRDSMLNSIREFSKKLSNYNVALFYYAGHGIQVEGVNYLIPINAKLENKDDCKWEAVAVNTVTDEFKRNSANTNIVILDACRNNPYKSWARGGEAGFKALSPINGTIISFSTSEGATAADGDGANGLFTEELVKQMEVPQQIESVFKQTRKEVMARSKGLQMPTEWSYLTGDFFFKKK